MEEAYNYIKNLDLKKNDTVVAAISGGPDSMALLYLLIKVKKELNIKVVCAHVNHNLREESKDELIFVRDYCNDNGVIFESMLIEKYGDDNFHNEARNIRYNYFEELVKKYKAKYLFTAHHGDDLMETILMRIVRGSTLKGYSGFEKVVRKEDYQLVRPLIHLTKEQIRVFMDENNLKYVTDLSNFKDKYTRNRFRKYILPKLKDEDKMVHDKFYKFSKTLLAYNNYIDKQVAIILDKIYVNNVLNIEEFLKQEDLIQTKIIYIMLEKMYQDDLMLLSDKHVLIVHNLIRSSKANAVIHLPNNIEAVKTYNNLEIKPILDINNLYEIEINEYLKLPNGKNIELLKESLTDGNDICRLSDVSLPLYVRNKKDGDHMTIKGMKGTKKVADIFINCKVNSQDRLLWPVVCDADDNVVWLPGLKKSVFCKQKEEKCDIILRYY